MLAMLVAGYMAKRQGAGAAEPSSPISGGLGGMLGGLLGGRGAKPAGSGGSGLASILDMNGDGNALDDIMRMAGKAMR